MSNPLVLTYDCGTQSIRALLVDAKGNIVAKTQKKFEQAYYSLKAGFAEQKPEVYWNAIIEVSDLMYEKYPSLLDDVIAVTVTTIRDTCVCLDKDGNAVRDIILWLDQREAKCEKPLPVLSNMAFAVVGMTEAIKDQRKITKSNWIKENEPENWAKTYKYVMFSGFMVHRFTGKFVESVASNIGHIPFDYKSKKWKSTSDIQYPVFDIEPDKLCELKQPGEELGLILPNVAKQLHLKENLPLIATGSDKGCETLGCGIIGNDMASLSFGTTATVQLSTKKYVEPMPLMPSYPAVVEGYYNPEIQVFRGYWMVSWFKKEFASKEVVEAEARGISAEELLNERLNSVPPGCEGLMLQPYWSPLLKIPEAKGSIIGFSSQHSRIHIYRAIIEGIGYGLIDGLRSMERRSKMKIKALTVSGGGSQSDAICQITADMFGVPVRRIQTYEACGLGSSLVAFVSKGVYKNIDEAVENMVHYKDEFIPNMVNHSIYNELYTQIYCKIYKQLKPLYVSLREIEKKHNGGK